ncbi:MAG: ABC-F family ATP-binding cassette domain-containing protein [Rickettsiales bacterium]
MPAPILSIRDACVRFDKNYLFENLSLTVCEGDKIALVGKNGAGKTTLINVITGKCEPETGERQEKAGLTVGYLSQDILALPRDGTVRAYVLSGMKEENRGEDSAYMIDMAVRPLGLDPEASMATLSGGNIRRAALARALAEQPDILLLDEPTNHLDLETILWLESYLAGYGGALLCISHDRAFLAGVTNRVFWLDRGRLRVCAKGFAHFETWAQELLDNEARELHNREKTLVGELEWANRGVKARRKRNVRRLEMAKEEKDRLERDQASYRKATRRLKIPTVEADEGSRMLAEFYRVDKHFDDRKILEKFSLKIQITDRIGVIGKNGAGKTTFLRLLTGEEEQDAGKIKRALNLRTSYFEQHAMPPKPHATVKEILCPEGGDYLEAHGKTRHVCGYLKDFMFDPKDAESPFLSLSGGQRNRLMLAKTLAKPGNLLILDEPTNDLDADTLDNLQDIINAYGGGLVIVSHDRDFLDRTVDKIMAFEGEGVVDVYNGGYSDYLAARERAEEAAKAEEKKQRAPLFASVVKEPVREPAKKLSYTLQREWENLPGEIEKLEREKRDLDVALADGDFYNRDPDGFDKAVKDYDRIKKTLDEKENRWLELEEMREEKK